jgi:hypothetical protein
LGGVPEPAATVFIKALTPSGVVEDPDGDQYWTPHPSAVRGMAVSLPYTTTLVTAVQYQVDVVFPAGRVRVEVPEQTAGSTVYLADLYV